MRVWMVPLTPRILILAALHLVLSKEYLEKRLTTSMMQIKVNLKESFVSHV